MAMTEEQAIEICEKVQSSYSLTLTDRQLIDWIEMLTTYGDYELSMKKLRNRILDENGYPPNLAEILVKPYVNDNAQQFNQVDEEVQRERADPDYREKQLERWKEIELQAKNGEFTIDDL